MSRLSLLLLILLGASLSLNGYLYVVYVLIAEQEKPVVTQQLATTNSAPSPAIKPIDSDTVDSAPTTTSALTSAQQYFEQGLFIEAIAALEQLQREDEDAANKLKQQWMAVLESWVKEKKFSGLDAFIEAFLARFPYDLIVMEVQAESWVARGQVTAAINQYHALISNTFNITQEEYYQSRIHHLGSEQLSAFKSNEAWQSVVNFADQLRQQEPDYPPYLLAQAEAYVRLEQFDPARQLLEQLLEISLYREQARSLLAEIDRLLLRESAIKLEPMGEHYLVSGLINDDLPIRLMIDTGASVSVITRARFDEIESWAAPEYQGESLINTAGGQVRAPVYRFERFQIDEFYINDVSFVVMDIQEMSDYHGLLGMNFLKQFKFSIDQANNLLILSP